MDPGRRDALRRGAVIAGVGIALVACAVFLPDGFLLGRGPGAGPVFVPRVSFWTGALVAGVLVVGAVLAASLAVSTIPNRRRLARAPWWVNLVLVVAAVILATSGGGLATLIADRRERLEDLADRLSQSRDQVPPEPSHALGALLMVALVLAIAGLAAVLLILYWPDRYGRAAVASAEEAGDEHADAFDSARTTLLNTKDPRDAVIAAYATLEGCLQDAGVRKRRSDTPFEFLQRALRRRRVSKERLHRLASLFEIARFSTHPVDEPMRDEAEQTLSALRAELESKR